MARKRYELSFNIDSRQAEAAAKRVTQALTAAEAAAKRSGVSMAAAYDRAARAAEVAATKMATSVNGVAIAQRALEQSAARASAVIAKGLAGATQSARALEAAMLAANKQFVSTRQNATTAANAVSKVGQAAGGASGLVAGFAGNLGLISAGTLGVNEVRRSIEAIAAGLKSARDYAQETASANLKLYEGLREISYLKGERSVTAATAASQHLLAIQSGLTPEETRRYVTGFESDIFAARNKGNLRPAQGTREGLEQQMRLAGARFSAARDVAPDVAANIITGIGQGRPITRVEDAKAEIALMLQNLAEGKGTSSELSDQVMRARGTMMGAGFSANLADVGAYISTLSLNNPAGRTATRLESIISSVTKATSDPKSQGKLAKLGITAQNRDLSDILARLGPVVEAADRPGGIGGIAALRDLGFTDSRAMLELYKAGGERTLLSQQLARNQAGLGSAEAVTEAAAQFDRDMASFRASKTGQDRFASAKLAGAEYLRGLPGEQLAIERKQALADLITERKIRTPTAEVMKAIEQSTLTGQAFRFGGKTGEERLIDNQVAKRLIDQAKASGVSAGRIQAAAPDLLRVAQGQQGTALSGLIGEDLLGLEVQNLKDITQGGQSGPAARGALRSMQGRLPLNEQLQKLIDDQIRNDAARSIGPGAMLEPGLGSPANLQPLLQEMARLTAALERNSAVTDRNNQVSFQPVAPHAPAQLGPSPRQLG